MTRKLVGLLALLAALALPAAASAATPKLAVGDASPSGGHVCVITESGKLYCWGGNTRGELGVTAGMSDSNGVPAPQLVPLPGPAIDVAAGNSHTCALVAGGSAYCWGSNWYGEIGSSTNVGTFNPNPTPTLVPTGGPVSAVFAGDLNSCFLLADGTAKCVGDNEFGQLAAPIVTQMPSPAAMQFGGVGVKKVVIGSYFTCALLTTLSVKCTGFNSDGQLGTNAHLGSGGSTPVTAGLSGLATDVEAGNGHACAILQDATTWCWGADSVGQLGDGDADSNKNYNPEKVSIGPARQLAAGSVHTCALLTSPGVDCWGSNVVGQLGVPDNVATLNPNPAPLFSSLDGSARTIAAGAMNTCAIRADGAVQCAGDNSESQLGIPRTTTVNSYIPVTVPGLNVLDAPAPKKQTFLVKPKLKFKKSGSKIAVSARASLGSAAGSLAAADCTGRASARLERKSNKKYRKVAASSPRLSFKKGRCGFDMKLKLEKKYGGKKLYLHVVVPDGTATLGFDKRLLVKVKRIRF